MKVSNLVLWVQDATLSYRFYKKLGFTVDSVTDRDATVACGGFEIILVTMRDENEFNGDSLAAEKGKGMYIYVNVENVDTKHAALKQLGLELKNEPRDWPWGNREFVVSDPDGYKICFWQKI